MCVGLLGGGKPIALGNTRVPRSTRESNLKIHSEVHMSTPSMTVRRFHRTMESTKQEEARGAREVRRGTSSIHVHCLAPQSSNHTGHGTWRAKMRTNQPLINNYYVNFSVFSWDLRTPKSSGKKVPDFGFLSK